MTDRLLLVSTCGTSLLVNGADSGERTWLTEFANEVEVDKTLLDKIITERRKALNEAEVSVRKRMSAELGAIDAVIDLYKPKQLHHLLVHSDTALGKAAAGLLQAQMRGQSSLVSTPGLRTKHLASFRDALAELTKALDETVSGYRAKGWVVVFNLTGGYKALNSYLQALGMIVADRCVFLFEGETELMQIPRLPVKLAEADVLLKHATVFRRLNVGYPVRASDAENVPESLLMELDDEVTISIYGDLVWTRHHAELFTRSLCHPLSQKVHIAGKVQKAFAGLSDTEKIQINEAMDAFSAHMDNVRPLLKSRTFKKLSGTPVPGSTHELYAWSDGAAGRLMGHYEGDIFVFDQLMGHL